MKKLLLSVSLLFVLALAACGDTGEEGTKDTTNTTNENEEVSKETSNEETQTNKDVYFKDNEVQIEDLKINITETKVIPVGQPGNEYGEKPVFAIWYNTTNLSDKEIDPLTAWIAVFTAIQDNNPNAVNELETGSLPDDSFLDSQMENIKKDGTVENAFAYELDDSETPVTLVATQGLLGEELGRQDYEIKQ